MKIGICSFVVGFFALCVLYAHACDRILGPDEAEAAGATTAEPSGPNATDDAVAA